MASSSLGRKPELNLPPPGPREPPYGVSGVSPMAPPGPTSFHGGETASACGEAGGPHVIDPNNLQPADVFGRHFGERRKALAAGIMTISGPFLCCRDWRTWFESFEIIRPIVS